MGVKQVKRIPLRVAKAGKKVSPNKKKNPVKTQTPKLRSSITPGTVVIPVAGKFKGSRVVVLKQLEKSGLLLVTGPYSLNGVPLRRMNQRFVIATCTKLNVAKVDVRKFDDAYFKRTEAEKKKGKEEFLSTTPKERLSAAKKADQVTVDKAVLAGLTDPVLKKYLKSKFALSNAMMAHDLKF